MATTPSGRFDADRLRAAREGARLSQAELAARVGADPAIVSLWETREVAPTVRNLGRLAAALNLKVSDLYIPDSTAEGTLAGLRVAAGLSQLELAERLGVSQTTISRWERAKAAPDWSEITAYSKALKIKRTDVAAAIDTTAARRGKPPLHRKPARPADFKLSESSPHAIYESEGPPFHVTVFSPQFPNLALRPKAPAPSNLEIAVLNEHLEAGFFERYNHMQRRCAGSNSGDATYLIRWLSAYHETGDPAKHRRGAVAGNLIAQTPRWRSGQENGPRHPTSSGEYLIIVVEPEDTVGFLADQLVDDEPAMFYPTSFDHGIHPVTIRVGPTGLGEDRWQGPTARDEVPVDASFVELLHHLHSKDSGVQSIPGGIPARGAADGTGSDDDARVADAFSRPTPYDENQQLLSATTCAEQVVSPTGSRPLGAHPALDRNQAVRITFM